MQCLLNDQSSSFLFLAFLLLGDGGDGGGDGGDDGVDLAAEDFSSIG